MKRLMWMVLCGTLMMTLGGALAQDPAPAAPAGAAGGDIVTAAGGAAARAAEPAPSGGALHVIFGSGALATLLWLAIFGAFGTGVYFVVDCSIMVRPQKIMPQSLINGVTEAMAEGDVLKALQCCENEPGSMANILTAGFSHVEEGFDIIQESITTAADLETERLMQRITWLSVVGNIAPMLGLLGTVQGMIMAFGNLAGGAPNIGLLAQNISLALWTTAAGLTTAVPCVALYYGFRNTANRIVLRMEAITMELVKDLRNVEVVEG